MRKIMAALVVLAVPSLASIAHADQFSWIEAAKVQNVREAVRTLRRVPAFEYCEPCGDEAPKLLGGRVKLETVPQDSRYLRVTVGGKEIDLAYVFVQTGEESPRFENLAWRVGLIPSDVSRILTLSLKVTTSPVLDPFPGSNVSRNGDSTGGTTGAAFPSTSTGAGTHR